MRRASKVGEVIAMAGAPREGPSELPPALDFLQRLWSLNHSLERLSSAMERRFGVTAQQRLIVRCVGQFPGLTAAELSALLHLDPGTISTSLRRLVGKRLIRRTKDPLDRRRAPLSLTARGRTLEAPVRGTVEHAVASLLSELPEGTIAEVKSTLHALATLVAQEADGALPQRRARRRVTSRAS